MKRWSFKDYLTPAGTNVIAQWYRKELSPQEQADMDALLETLEKTEVWPHDNFRALSGAKYAGLWEIRWWGDQRVPLRLIGYLDRDKKEFMLLMGCNHKGKIYKPPGAIDTALTRWKQLTNEGQGGNCDHEIQIDNETPE